MVTGDAEGRRLVALLRRAGETRVWRKKMAGGDGAGGGKREDDPVAFGSGRDARLRKTWATRPRGKQLKCSIGLVFRSAEQLDRGMGWHNLTGEFAEPAKIRHLRVFSSCNICRY